MNRLATLMTLHCLLGCSIGEVAGMVIGTHLGLSNTATIILAIVLAFCSGYILTMIPLLRSHMSLNQALKIALFGDTISISVMEITDNSVMAAIPGAMHATLSEPLFWTSLAFALLCAGIVAWPVNRWMLSRNPDVHSHHH